VEYLYLCGFLKGNEWCKGCWGWMWAARNISQKCHSNGRHHHESQECLRNVPSWAAEDEWSSPNHKVAVSIPALPMLKCPWARHWTPSCSKRWTNPRASLTQSWNAFTRMHTGRWGMETCQQRAREDGRHLMPKGDKSAGMIIDGLRNHGPLSSWAPWAHRPPELTGPWAHGPLVPVVSLGNPSLSRTIGALLLTWMT